MGRRAFRLVAHRHPDGNRLEDFSLTRQETRVAAALVDGLTVKEIANAFGVASETVRQHLKAIFAKTNTHRQAELVRLLVSSSRQPPDP